MNSVQKQDIEDFVKSFPITKFSDQLKNSTFLITGATGLIGSSLIHCLLALKQNIHIIAPVRNKEKALNIFGFSKEIEIIECNLDSLDYKKLGVTDYVIHCAAPTSSKFFVEKPVETFNTILQGTSAMLEYAKSQSIKSFVYLSSLEVYGENHDDSVIMDESYQGYLNPLSVRSSYPMAKRAAENLCFNYAKEYNIPIKIARLAQTTGAGIAKEDDRALAQFSKLIIKGQDIILRTTGESARPCCYTMDAISAILYILLAGRSGEAYNVANDSTYISVRGMAEYLQKNFNPSIKVRIELNENMGYPPATKQKLTSEKLRNLGWAPHYGLKEVFERLIKYLK